jgi:hypothetical protein
MRERDAPRLNRKPPGGSPRFQLPTFSAVTDAIGSHPSGERTPVPRWAVYQAGKTHARSPAPDHACYAQVKDRCNGKHAALSEARKILRQAHHILAEPGDDALAPTA